MPSAGYASPVHRRPTLLALAAAGAVASAQILPRPATPDLILFNGKVITVDRNVTIHEAVAISGDGILTLGNYDQMKTLGGPSTRMIDLEGRTVIPGLMDNHLHGAGGGPGVDLSRARSLADVEAALAARIKATPAAHFLQQLALVTPTVDEMPEASQKSAPQVDSTMAAMASAIRW